MPKRDREKDTDEYLQRKLRKIEKKLKKRNRRRRISSSSNTSDLVNASLLEDSQESQTLNNEDVESAHIFNEHEVTSEVLTSEQDVLPSTSQPPLDVPELDDEILSLLGEAPSKDKKYGAPIQNDLSIRLEHISTSGLSKEIKKELLEKYLTPGNCKKVEAPILNPEVKAALSEWLLKKDKALENKQKQISASISCLSQALTKVLASEHKDPEVLKLLLDASKIICDTQYNESITRRNFICTSIKKELKNQLENTEIDQFLFSEKLPDTLREAKAIYRSANEIKNNNPSFRATQGSKNYPPKNFKPQLPPSRPVAAPRRQAPAPSHPRAPPAPRRKPPPPPPQQRYYNRPPPRR